LNTIWHYFLTNLHQTSLIETVAVFFGIVSVWYAKKNHVLVFPTGIISVATYVFICFQFGLYADMGINAFYFIMSVFGWYNWTHKNGNVTERLISYTNAFQKVYLILSGIAFFVILQYVLMNYTDSNVPTLDALATSIFLLAMWLMALKKIEHWILWIIGDAIAIPLFASKTLILSAFQYFIFFILAILGYFSWKVIFQKQQATPELR
jgi:nicotinamide mononucleotide transporter